MAVSGQSCQRCKSPSASLTLRNAPTCGPCFTAFVDAKIGRRLGIINRETNSSKQPTPRRYLVGLSGGCSSTVLLRVLDESAKYHSSKRSSTAFEPHVVFVDTSEAAAGNGDAVGHDEVSWGRLKAAFGNLTFERVCLSRALELDTVDLTSLGVADMPELGGEQDPPARDRLANLFDGLPSATSRADVQRLLVRHVLVHMAMEGQYNALLLGHNTTSLAALTLSEVANGRGFSVPFQVNDGPLTVTRHAAQAERENAPNQTSTTQQVSVYFPVREILRHEILKYLDLTPSLKELVKDGDGRPRGSVVSHKDVSIEEVMRRYFETTEGPYSGIVANVVRTAGKLDRRGGTEPCGLCGMTLDELGDTTWAGQMGDDEVASGRSGAGCGSGSSGLCYGCKRSMHG